MGYKFRCEFRDDGSQTGKGSAGSRNVALVREDGSSTAEVLDVETLFGVADIPVIEGVIRPAICRNAYGFQECGAMIGEDEVVHLAIGCDGKDDTDFFAFCERYGSCYSGVGAFETAFYLDRLGGKCV